MVAQLEVEGEVVACCGGNRPESGSCRPALIAIKLPCKVAVQFPSSLSSIHSPKITVIHFSAPDQQSQQTSTYHCSRPAADFVASYHYAFTVAKLLWKDAGSVDDARSIAANSTHPQQTMADIPRPPALTPQFCFSSGALRGQFDPPPCRWFFCRPSY